MEEQTGNPTQTGASTSDRLAAYLVAEAAPVVETPEVVGEVEEETPETEQAEAEAPDTDDGEAPEGPQISATDLAALLEVEDSIFDVDAEGKVIVKTKIDGKDGAAKFKDVLAAYQLRGHIDNQSREVAEQKKALQAQVETATQAAQAKMQEVEYIAGLATQELMAEYQAIDWNALRYTDPGEFAAKQAEFQQRQSKINGISQHIQMEKQKFTAKAQEQEQELLKAEAQKMRAQIPGWSDETVAAKEWAELDAHVAKQLAAFGEPPESLSVVRKAFHIDVLRKAMLYDKMQTSKAGVEKLVRLAPKLVKPGSKPVANSGKNKELQTIKSNIKTTGGARGDMAAYLLKAGKV